MSFNLSLKCLRIFLELSSIGLRLSLDEEKENPCPVFLFSMKREIRSNYAVSRRSRATTEKKIYKTRNALCKVVVLLIRRIAFLSFSLPSPSSFLKQSLISQKKECLKIIYTFSLVERMKSDSSP